MKTTRQLTVTTPEGATITRIVDASPRYLLSQFLPDEFSGHVFRWLRMVYRSQPAVFTARRLNEQAVANAIECARVGGNDVRIQGDFIVSGAHPAMVEVLADSDDPGEHPGKVRGASARVSKRSFRDLPPVLPTVCVRTRTLHVPRWFADMYGVNTDGSFSGIEIYDHPMDEHMPDLIEKAKTKPEPAPLVPRPTAKDVVNIDIRACGIGDVVCLAYLAEGYRDAGIEARFLTEQGSNNHETARMLNQVVVNEPRPAIAAGNHFPPYKYELRVEGRTESRIDVWSRRMPYKPNPRKPDVLLPPCCMGWADKHMASDRPNVLLFPLNAGHAPRLWPKPYWIDLTNLLLQSGVNVVVPWPEQRAKEIPREWPTHTIVSCNSIKRLFAVIDRADYVVSVDTGPAHIAGVLEQHGVVLCGPSIGFFDHYEGMTELHAPSDRIPCSGCGFKPKYGFRKACGAGCQSLMHIRPAEVAAVVLTKIGIDQENAS